MGFMKIYITVNLRKFQSSSKIDKRGLKMKTMKKGFICDNCKKENIALVNMPNDKKYCKQCAYQIVFERFINKVVVSIIMMAIALILLYYKTVIGNFSLTLLVVWVALGTRSGAMLLFQPNHTSSKGENIVKILVSIVIGFPLLAIETILSPYETYRMVKSVKLIRKNFD